MTRPRLSTALLAVCVLACSKAADAPKALGALSGGIISGRVQTAQAGAVTLPAPVIDQVVRSQTGALQLRRLNPLERVLLPALAFAQTVVNGSPVVGAVVCVYELDKDLIPSSRCTNTGADGKATFFFQPPTAAGNYIARINGSLTTNGKIEATTFDTAKATVYAAAPDSNFFYDFIAERTSPAVFSTAHLTDRFTNPVPYRIQADALLTAQDTALGSIGARTVTFTAKPDSVWRTTMLTGDKSASLAQFKYRLVVGTSATRIQAVVCGLKVNPCTSATWSP